MPNIDEEDERLLGRPLTRNIIRCAIRVHRELGPGLLENVYRTFLAQELRESGLSARSEATISATYKGSTVECGYRADLIVEEKVLLELKAIERLLPLHDAQILTYLKLTGLRVGLLLNYNVTKLVDGMRRFAV